MIDAYRRYRVDVRQRAFTEQHLKVLDFILGHSYGRPDGRAMAWVPMQKWLALCCGMDAGDLSKTLKWLLTQNVIEVKPAATKECPKGLWLAMLPPQGPPGWSVPLNVDREAQEVEAWLERVSDPMHPELWPEPSSLNDALREVFVETSRESRVEAQPGRGESSDRASSRNRSESVQQGDTPAWDDQVGDIPSPDDASPGGRVGEFPSRARPVRSAAPAAVGNFPTSSPPREAREQTRPFSRETSTRSREGAGSGVSTEYRAYVDSQLFALVGEQERRGKCGQMWQRALRDMPEELNELIGQAKMLRNEGRIRVSVGAWLNRSVYQELQKMR